MCVYVCVCACVCVFVCACACFRIQIQILRKISCVFKKKSKEKANRKGILYIFRDFTWRHFDVELTSIWRWEDVNRWYLSSMMSYLIVQVASSSLRLCRMRYVEKFVEISFKIRSIECRNYWRFWRRNDVYLLVWRPMSIESTSDTYANTKQFDWKPGDTCRVKLFNVLAAVLHVFT